MESMESVKDGDLVRLIEGVGSAAARRLTYRVVGRKQVNLLVEPTTGGRRTLVKPAYVVKVTSEAAATVTTVLLQQHIVLGAVVTFEGKQGLYVVIGSGTDTYKVARLGGNDDRYYARVSARLLTVVDIASLLKGIAQV